MLTSNNVHKKTVDYTSVHIIRSDSKLWNKNLSLKSFNDV